MVLAWVLAIPVTLQAQSANDAEAPGDSAVERTFRSRADSLEWSRARARAENARGLHLVVSLQDRRIWVRRDDDTLRTAEAGVASGLTIEYAGRSWTFRTPRGRHTVQRKMTEPVWTPPVWMYAEAALEHDLELGRRNARSRVPVGDGRMLVIRQGRAGVLDSSGTFRVLPTSEHIVFDGTLYIPPYQARNRQVPGALGAYALDLGDGYLIHGTDDPSSVGRAVTHGCIRLADDDIAWLYRHIPVGTPVYVY
jgi:hypothetical protein